MSNDIRRRLYSKSEIKPKILRYIALGGDYKTLYTSDNAMNWQLLTELPSSDIALSISRVDNFLILCTNSYGLVKIPVNSNNELEISNRSNLLYQPSAQYNESCFINYKNYYGSGPYSYLYRNDIAYGYWGYSMYSSDLTTWNWASNLRDSGVIDNSLTSMYNSGDITLRTNSALAIVNSNTKYSFTVASYKRYDYSSYYIYIYVDGTRITYIDNSSYNLATRYNDEQEEYHNLSPIVWIGGDNFIFSITHYSNDSNKYYFRALYRYSASSQSLSLLKQQLTSGQNSATTDFPVEFDPYTTYGWYHKSYIRCPNYRLAPTWGPYYNTHVIDSYGNFIDTGVKLDKDSYGGQLYDTDPRSANHLVKLGNYYMLSCNGYITKYSSNISSGWKNIDSPEGYGFIDLMDWNAGY